MFWERHERYNGSRNERMSIVLVVKERKCYFCTTQCVKEAASLGERGESDLLIVLLLKGPTPRATLALAS